MLDPQEERAKIEWERGLCVRQWFSLREAACIIEGIHPSAGIHEPPTRITDMQISLIETMHELERKPDGSYNFSHQSFTDWCHRRDLEWPLRAAQHAQPVTGVVDTANLAQRLAEAEPKAERLAQKVVALTAECDRLRRELAGLAEELVSAKKDAAQSQADLQQAEADLLQGKSRTSALKLVGGMAMAGFGLSIHDARLKGITDLLNDLDRVGVTISEDVIRANLKAAAEIIDAPKPRQL